jgi:hypothetical protein
MRDGIGGLNGLVVVNFGVLDLAVHLLALSVRTPAHAIVDSDKLAPDKPEVAGCLLEFRAQLFAFLGVHRLVFAVESPLWTKVGGKIKISCKVNGSPPYPPPYSPPHTPPYSPPYPPPYSPPHPASVASFHHQSSLPT